MGMRKPMVVNERTLLVEAFYTGVNVNDICFGCTTRIEASSTSSETTLPWAS